MLNIILSLVLGAGLSIEEALNKPVIKKCGRSKIGKNTPKMLGNENPSSKLTENDIRTIYLSNLKNVELAKIYNVSETNISYIKNKKQWKWFTDTLDKQSHLP